MHSCISNSVYLSDVTGRTTQEKLAVAANELIDIAGALNFSSRR